MTRLLCGRHAAVRSCVRLYVRLFVSLSVHTGS